MTINIEKLFTEYWSKSFPMAPANKQSAASHVAFAEYVLIQVEMLNTNDEKGVSD